VKAVDDTGRWRWERVLLVLAALFGVVAMHATVGPMPEPAMPTAGAAASVDEHLVAPVALSTAVALPSFVEHAVPAMAASSEMPVHGPMSMPHALMHLCLAILSAAIVLGLLAVAVAILLGHQLSPSRTPTPVATRPSRPPRRSALRLAQLCVLRN
jgi:hypothetical protein